MRPRRVLMACFAFCTLGTVVVFWREPFLTAAILTVLHATVLLFLGKRRLFFVYLFGFLFGPIAEWLSITAGAWTYTLPQFAGIPVWLPFLWGAATLTAGYFVSLETVYE